MLSYYNKNKHSFLLRNLRIGLRLYCTKDKENTYKQKKDVTFDNFEDVTITIEEDSCTIEMMSTDEGYGVKLVISKIGEIELTLPTVE